MNIYFDERAGSMMAEANRFQIKADSFQWIGGAEDDPHDLCLHAHVAVRIGDRILEDNGTVSATALYLLKSLTESKIMNAYDIQMIPCCGHFMIASEDLSQVTILGCDLGTDWSIIHEGDRVRLVLADGTEETVPIDQYTKSVLRFADEVEAFYQTCSPKILPEDDFARNGYFAFWNEWHRRYDAARRGDAI